MRAILFLLAALLTAPAHALVYVWKTVDLGGRDTDLRGRLEVADVTSRHIRYAYEYPDRCYGTTALCDWDEYADPNSPILTFQFYIGDDMRYVDLDYRAGIVGQEDGAHSSYFLTLGPTLIGSMNGGGWGSHVLMESDDSGLWTIEYFYRMGDYDTCVELEDGEANCRGVTGRWVLQAATQVPAPATIALLLPAIAALRLRRA